MGRGRRVLLEWWHTSKHGTLHEKGRLEYEPSMQAIAEEPAGGRAGPGAPPRRSSSFEAYRRAQ